jgi:hypothetical protein
MALRNIATKRYPFFSSSGSPLAGGLVVLTEPDTDTLVIGYQDSGLVTPHGTQQITVGMTTLTGIRLSGSGRINIWVNRNCDMRVYDKNGSLVSEELEVNPDSDDADSGGLVSNGSFEIDTNEDGTPDSWTLSSDSGSTNAIDTSESTEGAQSFRFTSSGSGGGSLTTTDFFAVNDATDLRVSFDIFSNPAGVRNIVRVQWFDISQVSISDTDVYDDATTNPTSWLRQNLTATPPSGARFAKLELIGCDSSDSTPGSTWFDRVNVFYPVASSGIIDNITIQANEIITTNTNGSLAITPNGSGSVDIGNSNDPDLSDSGNSINVGTDDPDNDPHIAVGPSIIQAKSDGTTATDLVINSLGGDVQIGDQAGASGNVELYFNGNQFLGGHATGAAVWGTSANNPTTTASQNATLNFTNNAGAVAGDVGFSSASSIISLTNRVHGGGVALRHESAAGALQNSLIANASASVELYYNNVLKVQTENLGVSVRGALSNDPATGGNQDVIIQFENSAGNNPGTIGYTDSNTNLFIRNKVHGGRVIATAETSGGTVNNLFNADPGGIFTIYHNGSAKIATSSSGAAFRGSAAGDPDLGDPQTINVVFADSAGLVAGAINYNNSANLELQNVVYGGSLLLRAVDSSGNNRTMFDADPDDNLTLQTFVSGSHIILNASSTLQGRVICHPDLAVKDNDASGNSADPVLYFLDNANTELGSLGVPSDSNSDVVLSALVSGADLRLEAGDTTGEIILETESSNVVVKDTAAAGASAVPIMIFRDQADAQLGQVGMTLNGLELTSNVHGGSVDIRGESSGGATRSLIACDPDAGVSLFFNGSQVTETLAASAGGLEVNNTLTGSGMERVLTESDLNASAGDIVVKSSNQDKTSDATMALDSQLFVSVTNGETYFFELFISYQGGSTSNGLRFSMGGTLTGARYYIFHYAGATTGGTSGQGGSGPLAGQNEFIADMNGTSSTSVQSLFIRGYVTVSGSGTLGLSWAQETSSGDLVRVNSGSYIKVTRVV